MSKKDQGRSHSWKKRVKDWLIVPHSNFDKPHDVSPAELATHHTRSDCWVAVDGVVYDLTRFVPYHPGGARILEMYAGRDATIPFARNHVNVDIMACIPSCRVGLLLDGDAPPSATTAAASPSSPPPPQPPAAPTDDSVSPPPPPPMQSSSGATDTNIRSTTSSSSGARKDDDSESVAPGGVTPTQLVQVAVKSQLFSDVAQEELSGLAAEALRRSAKGEIDDDTALKELFARLDVEGRGFIKRVDLRNVLYRLDPDGASEDVLLRTPELITLPLFQRIIKQM